MSLHGNKYIMVITDQFTKWAEAFAVPDQSSETTARTLLEEFISRFGAPLEIHTDQGRNFQSEMFRNLCKLLGVTQTRTTPYHPASNGQVERFNRTVLQNDSLLC
jgi:transposase InsO family protein